MINILIFLYEFMLRTHTCGQLTASNIWEKVTLCGWSRHRRDHGWIIFIDLADRYGISQVVFDPEHNAETHKIADKVRSEYVLKLTWTVRQRPQWQQNPKLVTWEIEVIIDEIEILSESKVLPFEIDEFSVNVWEEIRYKYRYLDIRRKSVLENIKFRSKFLHFTRNWFVEHDFFDVQTPILANSSPEWARDYLIPSRLNPWKFYALPQAPQQFKQLLMVGWIDKYFQVAACFRDEDPRADRHAWDFYQIDCEMSFVEQDDVFTVVENYLIDATENLSNKKIIYKTVDWLEPENWRKFFKMTYDQSMNDYWTDKPDLRFGLKFVDLTDIFVNSDFWVFKSVCDTNWTIKAIKLSGQNLSRKDIDDLTEIAKSAWAKGLAYIIYEEEWAKSPILKFFKQEEIQELEQRLQVKTWDIVFFSADEFTKAVKILNTVRLALRDKYNLANKDEISYCWITDFPIFEKDEKTWKIDFEHNPFSMPAWWITDLEKQWDDLLSVKWIQYDLSCNGYEILSWAIRNHRVDSLVKAFEKVWRNKQEVMNKFGAMYEAFQYWAPPHGGFAIWMDRLMMVFIDENNVREVYAFPKTWKWQDLMMNSPANVDDAQLEELYVKIDLPEDL